MSPRRAVRTASRAGEGVRIALGALAAHKMRAALTILGIAIGVTVVIAMGAAITGINRSVTAILEKAGPKTFFVLRFFQGGVHVSDGSDERSPWRRNAPLTVDEAELLRRLPTIRDVNVGERTRGPVSYGGVHLRSVPIAGVDPQWMQVNGGDLLQGRNFTRAEYAAGARVVVINDHLAEALFPGLDPLGKTIKIFGQPFTVVGIHAEAASLFGDANQPRAVLPHTVFTKVAEFERGWLEFAVVPTEGKTVAEAQDQVVAALRTSRRLRPGEENTFAVVTQDKLLETFDRLTAGIFLAMIALSGVGLLVGGVGVVAIMLISVSERTREIGLRKALGATRGEILLQFLVEAATLTLVGCLIGLAIGAALAWAVRSFSPLPATVPLASVAAALLAAVLTGVLFGLYPAVRAANLDPVDALRYE